MSGYTKLFNSILMSSIWEEPSETRIVWVTLLALADQHGHVDGTVKSLARVARVPLPACQTAIETFLGPDPDDRSGVDGGRRIRVEAGGWLIVNHATYRNRMSIEDRRERDRQRKRTKRAMSAVSPRLSANVRDVSQAEAEADTKADVQEISLEPLRASKPAALQFPVVGKDGPIWKLTEDQVTAWKPLYPSLDVLDECRHALAWSLANPARRKTGRGMLKFLVAWLTRSNDRPRASRPVAEGPREPSWMDQCRAAGHDPACRSADAHKIRLMVAERGCTHPGVCESFGQHQQRIGRPVRTAAAS